MTCLQSGHARVALCFGVLCLSSAALCANTPTLDLADEHFAAGRFGEAEEVYSQVLAENPDHPRAQLRLGELALLSNDLDEAHGHLVRVAPDPELDERRLALLQELHMRRHDFAAAARLAHERGHLARGRQLESFADEQPYLIEQDVGMTRIDFVQTDPLPVVRLRLNDQEAVHVIIDTGGGELILDPAVAERLGLERFGGARASFAADRRAPIEYSRADRVQIGEFVVANVPVTLLDTSRFAAVSPTAEIGGVLGTVLLSKFRSTLDYPAGSLILESRDSPRRDQDGAILVPMWLAGDHFMVARGAAGGAGPFTWFIDTGLAGGGFLPNSSTLEATGVSLEGHSSFQGAGGGGAVTVTPFVMPELSLGALTRTDVPSLFGAFPESLTTRFGFRIDGIVSHAFFRGHRLTFDFDAMELVLLESASPNASE